MDRSNRHAWKALEVALTGTSLWSRLTRTAETNSVHQQVRRFLDGIPLPGLEGKEEYQRKCLRELEAALGKGLLFGELVPGALLEKAGALAALSDPQAVLRAEKKALRMLAADLQKAGFTALGWLLDQPAQAADSVVVVAVRYFFRREVEADPQLARGLQLTAMENLVESQCEAFRNLEAALGNASDRIEKALAEAQSQMLGALDELKGSVAASDRRLESVQDDVRGLKANMEQLLARLDMLHAPLRPSHSLSIRNDRERRAVEQIESAYGRLSELERNAEPDLAAGLGKLQMAAGQFANAEASFQKAARLARSDASRAEAHYNTFRAALEQQRVDDALRELKAACSLDPGRFAPFPLEIYEMLQVLGAGGFGVTFLCRHRLSKGLVAIKSLNLDDLDRDVSDVMEEASALEQVRHPAVIGMRDCGYAGGDKGRPFLVMEYFDGATLQSHVEKHGPLALDDALRIGTLIAGALQAAHGKGLLHRDVKPANVLLRRGNEGWDLRVIDFGLAIRQERLRDASTSRRLKTITGSSIAGTIDFAAPEQIGKLPGEEVAAPADVYSFGRTLGYALFGTPELTLHQYRSLPDPVADFLSRCLQMSPKDRPQDFAEVLEALEQIRAGSGGGREDFAELTLELGGDDSNPVARDEAPASPGHRRRQPHLQRKSKLPWLAVGVLLLAVVGVVVFLAVNRKQEEQPAATKTPDAPPTVAHKARDERPTTGGAKGPKSQGKGDLNEPGAVVKDTKSADPVNEPKPDPTKLISRRNSRA